MIERYLKAILDNSPESIVLIGKNHEVLACNKAIKEVLFEYFKREIKEGDLYYPDFVIEPKQKLYLEAFNKGMKGEAFYVQDFTQNENVAYWFEYKMNPIYDDDATLLGVSLSANNITKEKEAELKIIDLSEKLRAILDNTDELIILLDLDYKILAINTFATRIIKYNTNIIVAVDSDFRELVTDKGNLFYEYYPKALNGISSEVEISFENAGGEWLWYQTKFNPVYDVNKQLIGVSMFAQEITEKKKLELSLKESEDCFRKITALAPIGIIITNKNFDIGYANVNTKKMLEYEERELYTLCITDIISNFTLSSKNKIRVDELNIDLETPIFNQEQFVAITKSNSKLDILLSSSSFYSRNEQYIFIIQDITNIKQKEELIAEQNTKLRDIAWHQSHIIRAPLARIMGLISLLEAENFKGNVDKSERSFFYKAILDSSHELDKVIHDIVGKTE